MHFPGVSYNARGHISLLLSTTEVIGFRVLGFFMAVFDLGGLRTMVPMQRVLLCLVRDQKTIS